MTKTLTKEETAHVQFRIPKSKRDEFRALAMDRYGPNHGAKTAMFLHMLEEYQASQRIEKLRQEIDQLEQLKREARER